MIKRVQNEKGVFIKKHGMCGTLEYHAWVGMRKRVSGKHERYKTYNGKGIEERWLHSFEEFFKDMGYAPSPKHSLERKDNARGYFNGNCIWATTKEQNMNYSRNRILEYNGEKLNVTQWSIKLKIKRHLIFNRLKKGWSIEKTLITPPLLPFGKTPSAPLTPKNHH